MSAKLTLLQARHAIRRCSAEASCLCQNQRKQLTARWRSRQKGTCKGLLMLSCILAWRISWSKAKSWDCMKSYEKRCSLFSSAAKQASSASRCLNSSCSAAACFAWSALPTWSDSAPNRMSWQLQILAAATTPVLVEWRKELHQVDGNHNNRACSISCWRWASSSSPRKRA